MSSNKSKDSGKVSPSEQQKPSSQSAFRHPSRGAPAETQATPEERGQMTRSAKSEASTPRSQWQSHDPSSKKDYRHPAWGKPAETQASPEEQRQFAKDFGSVLVVMPPQKKR